MSALATRTCPQCGASAPSFLPVCRGCGYSSAPPPAPSIAAPAPPVEPSAEEQYFTPTTFQPVAFNRVEEQKRRGPWPVVAIVVLCLAIAGGWFVKSAGGGGGSAKASNPVVLEPKGPNAGLPSLADAVRVQAESTRQLAFAAIAVTYSEQQRLDLVALAAREPSVKWLDGSTRSTGPHEVSVSSNGDDVTIAIAASNKEVCAYGRWSPGAIASYVTMGNDHTCQAASAPADGWTQLQGGSNTDLPPEGY